MMVFAQWNLAIMILMKRLFPSCSYRFNETNQRVADIPATDENDRCAICLENKACIVYVPCGHKHTCQECSTKVGVSCQHCRAIIEQKIRVYK